MRKMTTKEIFAESFREIAERKNVGKITIGDIAANCEMSSATFYRHFRDKYDLIAWIYGQECDEIMQRYKDYPRRLEDIAAGWVGYCEENRDYLLNLINNTSGYSSFFTSMVESHIRAVEKDIAQRSGKDALTEKVHMMVYLFSAGMVRLMYAWLAGKIEASKEALVEAIVDSIPASLLPLITQK